MKTAKDTFNRDKTLAAFWPKLSRISASYEAIPYLQTELAQEMALAIWQALANFRGESSIDTFCYRIAHNVAVGHIKQQVRQVSTTHEEHDLASELSLEHTIVQEQKLSQLMAAIRQLPIVQRQIVTLYLDGVKQREIADIVGLRENNIAVNINRAKQSLKQLMTNSNKLKS